jgi:hypothetical protein
MNFHIERGGRALDMPLNVGPRLLLVLAAALICASFAIPFWRLTVSVSDSPASAVSAVTSYGYRLGLGADGREIAASTGAPWTRHDAAPPAWISVGVAFMALFFARVAILGTTRSLIDASVLYVFVGVASLWSFATRLAAVGRSGSPGHAPASIGNVLFGQWNDGSVRFAASPGAGAGVLLAVLAVLVAALFVSWRSTREELSADLVVAG